MDEKQGVDINDGTEKLGFGLMRLPSLDANDPGKIDMEQTKRWWIPFSSAASRILTRRGCTARSRVSAPPKEALVQRHPRDSFTLATKLHSGFIKTKEDRDRIFNEQREKDRRGIFRLLPAARHQRAQPRRVQHA